MTTQTTTTTYGELVELARMMASFDGRNNTTHIRDIARSILAKLQERQTMPSDVVRLIIAARNVAYSGGQSREEIKELDAASEAFADRVPWEDEPDAKN